jgi:hypothetical protein
MPQYVIVEELDDGTKVERLEWGAQSVWFKTNQTFPYCVYDTDGTTVYPVTDAELAASCGCRGGHPLHSLLAPVVGGVQGPGVALA